MKSIKIILNSLALFFTIILITYGYIKGFDIIELLIYDLYFIVIILTQIINLLKTDEKEVIKSG